MSLEATLNSLGDVIDYTASGAKTAGDVLQLGGRAGIAVGDIADGAVGGLRVRGNVSVRKITGSMAAGVILYWDEDGSSVSGETGAVTTVQADGDFVMGCVGQQAAAASGDERVICSLNEFDDDDILEVVGDIDLQDDQALAFGTDDDVTMTWVSATSILQVSPKTDDTGTFNFGNGTADIDVKIFLGTTGEYVEFNVGDSQVNIEGVPMVVTGAVTVGVDGTGHDVIFYGDTASSNLTWDQATDTLQLNAAALDVTGAVTVGVDSTGHDVIFYGDTASSNLTWDQATDTLQLNAANLLATGTITVGIDGTGHDVIFYGATASAYMKWDEGTDQLVLGGVADADLGAACEADAYTVGGVTGADFNGAVTNITVVKGIVTAAS